MRVSLSAYERSVAAVPTHDLGQVPIDQLRQLRHDLRAVEDGVSLQRRIVQSRLDLIRRELDRRRTGHGSSDVHDLLADLPDSLSERPAVARSGRPVGVIVDPTEELLAEADHACSPDELTAMPALSDADLLLVADRLADLERVISDRRRHLFDLIDGLSAELTRRYRSGEATVDSLLS